MENLKFSVTEECITCDNCSQLATDFFALNDEQAYLIKQPVHKHELKACHDALASCPVEAIHCEPHS